MGRLCIQAGRERLNFAKQFSAVVSERDACSTSKTLQGCMIYRIFFAQMMEETFAGSRLCVASPSQRQDVFLTVPFCALGHNPGPILIFSLPT